MRLKKIEPIVESILVTHPETRNSDMLLYRRYVLDKTGIDILQAISIEEFKNLPKYESVTRCRRKLQEQERKLIAMGGVPIHTVLPYEEVEARRKELEAEYEEYARGDIDD